MKCYCIDCTDTPDLKYLEQHRHECEVRMILSMGSKDQRRGHLVGIEKKRGKAAADRLRSDILREWKK